MSTMAATRLRKTFHYPDSSDDEDTIEAGMDLEGTFHPLYILESPPTVSPPPSPTLHNTTNLSLQTAKPSSPTCKATTRPRRACTHTSSSYYRPASPFSLSRGSCAHPRWCRVSSRSPVWPPARMRYTTSPSHPSILLATGRRETAGERGVRGQTSRQREGRSPG